MKPTRFYVFEIDKCMHYTHDVHYPCRPIGFSCSDRLYNTMLFMIKNDIWNMMLDDITITLKETV